MAQSLDLSSNRSAPFDLRPTPTATPPIQELVAATFTRRAAAGAALTSQMRPFAHACHDMAAHFHRRGKLIVFGTGEAVTEAQHIAVEFVRPEAAGKRALPAITLSGDPAALASIARTDGLDEVFAVQLRLLGRAGDIALGIVEDGQDQSIARAMEQAHADRLLSVALVGGDGGMLARSRFVDHLIMLPPVDGYSDAEIYVTACCIMWELVHVFLQHPTLLEPLLL
jgi:D-sedoheptulose 7-phosphate isomerase